MFKVNFADYACEGDTISCDLPNGLTATARIYRDDCSDKPDERDDGFWPSLDPKAAGYIGDKSPAALRAARAKAERIMAAWRNDEWFYCGVVVTIRKGDHLLTHEFGNALWGVECNYPAGRKGRVNAYLREVANELLPEAVAESGAELAAYTVAELAQSLASYVSADDVVTPESRKEWLAVVAGRILADIAEPAESVP
jgi:hypothetical protein